MGMCVPSIAPKHCGKPHLSLNPLTALPDAVSLWQSYVFHDNILNLMTRVVHILFTMMQAEAVDTPN